MSFIYSKPKCNKGAKLIKTRCECKTQKKAPKIKKKTSRKTLKKPKAKKKAKTKKIKITLKKRKKKIKKVTIKKKSYRCPNGTRRNSKTGLCEPIKAKKEKKKVEKSPKQTLVIKSIQPSAKDMIAKSLSKLKSFSPSVNKRLKSLQTYTPELGLFGCKQQEISIDVKGKKLCVKWSSKKAKNQMMKNLTNSSIGKYCNNIITIQLLV